MNRCTVFAFLFALLALVPSAHSAQFLYEAFMDGPSDGTPSLGTGYATVLHDNVAHMLGLNATFTGLSGTTINSHIHAPTAVPFTGTSSVATPTPTFPGFPSGVTSGACSNTLDLTLASSWNASFITAQGGTPASAEADFASYLASGRAYWNIHSSLYAGGEIRGFFSHVPGDYNLNGAVDAADYVVWRNRLGNIGDGLVADANENSIVDAGDYTIWHDHFGETGHHHEEARGAVVSALVPEPAAMVLLATSGMAWPLLRRRTAKSKAKGSGPCFRPTVVWLGQDTLAEKWTTPRLCSSPALLRRR